jgi:hypothetical protein
MSIKHRTKVRRTSNGQKSTIDVAMANDNVALQLLEAATRGNGRQHATTRDNG